jgi:uncharacterized membrane protein YkvA (DUF1232 family)
MTRQSAWSRIRCDIIAAWLAARDPRTPWHVRALAAAVAAYALSPIDLIPDFIPVVGYLDDLLIVPAGVGLVLHLLPAPLAAEFRARAAQRVHSDGASSSPQGLHTLPRGPEPPQ